ITATTYTATGLSPGATIWFSIIAKNSSTGAVSERSLAISRVISATGLAAIGSIDGNNIICGAVNNIIYTVPVIPGVSSYTWTVPAGAVIASGQGTNTISVNYLVGSTSGNILVFATAGSCQTSTSSLAISFSNTAVAVPVSGGNQTQPYCSPNPLPILTASATVPAGFEVIWYEAASGGLIVPTPTLNSVGTVTYYAASRNTSTDCESNSRTPVTLTIVGAAAPIITTGSATTFCTGGSVTLTASSGNSYTWSNGAVTPSIIVNTAGNYTVTVNQGGGCINTSAPTMVTVNPLPTINITSNTSTTFCQGNNVTLTATAGNSYIWSNGATTPSITVSNAGSYSVMVNQGNACVNTSAPTLVTVNPLPSAVITATGPTSFCEGSNVVLNASPSSTYLWSNGATSQNITTSTAGNYSVTVTNTNGCRNTSASTLVNVTPKPTVTLSAFPYTRLFPGLNTTLNASSTVPVTYTWFRNGNLLNAVTGSTLPVNVDQLGNYSVTVTNGAGCSNSSSLLSIADSASNKLFIYPNPNKGSFQVAYYSNGAVKNTITVHDAKGARVYSKTFDINIPYQTMNVDVRNHGKGTYIVTLTNQNNKIVISEKVLVL
ncbi:MAG: T9SS type A sorting domain-containing protein, partial [Ferruginibacter sp.]